MNTEHTWFLLFEGSSVDGRGSPKYVGRTIDKHAARTHYINVKNNPYSIGKVEIITDNSRTVATSSTNWESYE